MWWENSFLNIRDRRLFLGNREAREIAETYGTPLFVYNTEQILQNYRSLYETISGLDPLELEIRYAMKANPNEGILKLLEQQGAGIDAVSPGEVDRALKAGFSPNRVLFTGTSVSSSDLFQVFQHDDLTVNIDAVEQLELMHEVKKKCSRNVRIKVSIRWNPGIGRGFNPRVVTAGKRSPDGTPVKFGIEENKVLPAFRKAVEYGFVPIGLHQHLGSGWVKEDFEAVRLATSRMVEMAAKLEREGFRLQFLDFGGGFGPRYSKNQHLFPVKRYIRTICRQIQKARINVEVIILEPGKYLVGDAGILLLKVEYMKRSFGNLLACVNGGTFNTVPRPAIYPQAHHPIVNCSNVNSGIKKPVTIAGNLCETGDVFGKEILMPVPKRGDILAVLCAGAYCRSMASNFNLREIPMEILI